MQFLMFIPEASEPSTDFNNLKLAYLHLLLMYFNAYRHAQ